MRSAATRNSQSSQRSSHDGDMGRGIGIQCMYSIYLTNHSSGNKQMYYLSIIIIIKEEEEEEEEKRRYELRGLLD